MCFFLLKSVDMVTPFIPRINLIWYYPFYVLLIITAKVLSRMFASVFMRVTGWQFSFLVMWNDFQYISFYKSTAFYNAYIKYLISLLIPLKSCLFSKVLIPVDGIHALKIGFLYPIKL